MKKEVKEKIKIKPLRECLEQIPSDKLEELYKESLERVGEKRPKKITKEEIIEYVYGDIVAKYMASLLFLSPKEIKELEEEINGNFIGEISNTLIEESFVFIIKDKYYVAEELIEALKEIKSKDMSNGKKALIVSYYIMSNGLLKVDKIIELMKETGYDITKREIIDIVKEYNFIIKNDIVYLNEVAKQFNEENKLLKIKEKNKYKIISFEEALAMMSIIENIKHSGAIEEVLKKKVKNEEKLNEIAETLLNVISLDIEFVSNVDKVIEDNNIELTVDESDNLINLLGDICEVIPSWSLNGFTPCEKYNFEAGEDENYEE